MRFATVFFALLMMLSCSANEAPDTLEATPGDALEGSVTEVTTEEGGAVTAFDLETKEGTATIHIDPHRDYGFDLTHLEEHASTGDPVFVETDTEADELVAVSIEDV
jgi:hypothetical protein